MALRQYLFAAQISDSVSFPNQTYDFLEQAFSIYEDQITDSKSQYSALMGIANTLQSTRSLDEEQFNTLALRTAQFGGKLLRRVDQARAIVCASHLWWAVDSPYLPESEEKPVHLHSTLQMLMKAISRRQTCLGMSTKSDAYSRCLDPRSTHQHNRLHRNPKPLFVLL